MIYLISRTFILIIRLIKLMKNYDKTIFLKFKVKDFSQLERQPVVEEPFIESREIDSNMAEPIIEREDISNYREAPWQETHHETMRQVSETMVSEETMRKISSEVEPEEEENKQDDKKSSSSSKSSSDDIFRPHMCTATCNIFQKDDFI